MAVVAQTATPVTQLIASFACDHDLSEAPTAVFERATRAVLDTLGVAIAARVEPKRKLAKPPTESLKRFYFDTIVHSKQALEFLVGNAGAERVLLGSDYPFDMGMPEGVAQVRSLSVPAADQAAILGARARALLETAPARAFA